MASSSKSIGPPLSSNSQVGELGRGAFGGVHSYRLNQILLAFGSKLPKSIAIKIINTNDPKLAKYVLREIEIAQRLRHANVIGLLGMENSGATIYLKMELANCDLSRFIENRTKSSDLLPYEWSYIASQLFRGLNYLHAQDIAHRDIKPANILAKWKATSSSFPSLYTVTMKICDFGLSRFVSDELKSATAVGTRQYMAPEVIKAHAGDDAFINDYKMADVFSAGVVLYQMCFGNLPFKEIELLKEEGRPLEMLARKDGRIPAISKMLKWTPSERCNAREAETELSGILKPKASLNSEDTADLHSSAAFGNIEVVKWLLDSEDLANRADAANGKTPLHRACEGGHLTVTRLLIERGAEVNTVDKYGCTPLHKACQSSHLPIVHLLVESGADINWSDKDGCTPLNTACSRSNLSVAEMLVRRGADLNRADNHGYTPLHFACFDDSNNSVSIARMLIHGGALLNAKTKEYQTPLYFACLNGIEPTVQLIIEKAGGAVSKSTSAWNETPLYVACKSGSLGVARLLIEKGADLNKGDSNGSIPLCLVSSKGDIAMARLLIGKGASVNTPWRKTTALHLACEDGHLRIAELLLQNGAEKDRRDHAGHTPLELVRKGTDEFMLLFQRY